MTNMDRKGYRPVVMRIYNKDGQLLLEDEVLCAYDMQFSQILALGKEAHKYTEEYQVMVENPLKWGAVANYTVYEKLTGMYVQKVMGRKALRKPHIIICVPAKLTQVQEVAFVDAVGNVAREMELVMKSYHEASPDKRYEGKNAPDLWIELVSDYYASEYFE